MEAFAQQAGTHSTWSSETWVIESGGARAAIIATVMEDAKQPPNRMRGVRLDLSNSTASDRIYLDEVAVARTIKALGEASAGMARANPARRAGRACFGAAEFWPLYNWPWNRYHELNADYCTSAEGASLILTGRHKPASYECPSEKPEHLADVLRTGLDQLKAH